MSDAPVTVELHPSHFGEARKPIASLGELRVEAFRYPSGVAALGVTNGVGSLILLPFQGQQIWDAEFHGRRLTMLSAFDEPQPTRDYLRTYGAFFIHCGGTSMGNPGPDDDHPLHGELPNLPFQSAQLVFGRDEAGLYVELTGSARDTLAFHHDFVVRPRLRIREGASLLDMSVTVENRAPKPLPFLYLAHINFRPVDGGVLIDTVRDDAHDIALRAAELGPGESEAVRGYHAAVARDSSLHRTLAPGVPIEPELVLSMKATSDADGWAHAMQRHPDGQADFVSHRPSELPFAVRWITRAGERDALGLVLPATAPPDGLAAATANDQLVWIGPGETFRTTVRFGAAPASASRDLEGTIAAIRNR